MTAKPFRVSATARQDLLSIGRYTEREWGRGQRDHYLKQLDETFYRLLENPELGIACDDVLPGYRKIQQGAHFIYYKITDRVEVIRVLHERMEIGPNRPYLWPQ